MDEQLLSGRQILVIEDEMLVMMAIEDLLTDLGCTSISAAGTIEKALEMVSAQSFDLATLDVNLNGRHSDAVARALSHAGVPFAVLTGYGEQGVGDDFDGHPVLNKPYNCSQLTKVLSELLASGNPPALTC